MPTKRIEISVLNERKPGISKLKAIEYVERHVSKSGITRSRIKCLCECGNIYYAVVCDFLRGNPISCGCYKNYHSKYRHSKYKNRNKRLYQMWRNMRERINNENLKSFKYYKDCKICQEWEDFDVFALWAMNNGYDDTKQIDKDIKGNGLLYSPATCCFVSATMNNSHRKNTKRHEYKGELLTLSEIAIKENMPYARLRSRMYDLKKTLQQAIDMK